MPRSPREAKVAVELLVCVVAALASSDASKADDTGKDEDDVDVDVPEWSVSMDACCSSLLCWWLTCSGFKAGSKSNVGAPNDVSRLPSICAQSVESTDESKLMLPNGERKGDSSVNARCAGVWMKNVWLPSWSTLLMTLSVRLHAAFLLMLPRIS